MGAHILSFSIMLNVLTEHAACTIIFTVIGFAVSATATLPRTLNAMTTMSYLSTISVIGAVFICMFGVGLAPGAKDTAFTLFNRGTQFYEGFGAVTNIIFAYGAGN
jgi:uncharacterized protein YacL